MRSVRSAGWVLPAAAAVALVLAAAGCGNATPGASPRPAEIRTGAVPSTPVHDQTAAETLARSLAAGVVLPTGSRMLDSAPTPGLEKPPQSPVTPNLADASRFALVPLDPGAALQFVSSHPPSGYTATGSGSGSTSGPDTPTEHFLMQDVSGMPPGVDSATILVSAVAASGAAGHSDVRVDAEVTWLPAKPAGLTVPPADTAAVVSVTSTQPSQPAPRQVVVTDPTVLDRLRTAADGLQPSLPAQRSCPADLGTLYHVAFKPNASSPPDITFTAGACGGVTVTRPDGTTGQLSDDAAFSDAYHQLLGAGGAS